ncbi:hypothetical protein LZ32DRAFT_41722 [Colletotrichum eremochloae]|nr:hypothetical protein LZ32DRAFT_41722 [Colletotrichum eremochloae]
MSHLRERGSAQQGGKLCPALAFPQFFFVTNIPMFNCAKQKGEALQRPMDTSVGVGGHDLAAETNWHCPVWRPHLQLIQQLPGSCSSSSNRPARLRRYSVHSVSGAVRTTPTWNCPGRFFGRKVSSSAVHSLASPHAALEFLHPSANKDFDGQLLRAVTVPIGLVEAGRVFA